VDDDGLWIKLSKPSKGGWVEPLKQGETEDPADGSRTLCLDVDHVVVCAGQEPLKELLPGLNQANIPAFLIGGAEAATELDAKRAIDQVCLSICLLFAWLVGVCRHLFVEHGKYSL
jgi:hypothetical protein